MKYIFEIVLRANIEEHTEEIREFIEDKFGVEILEINQAEEKYEEEIYQAGLRRIELKKVNLKDAILLIIKANEKNRGISIDELKQKVKSSNLDEEINELLEEGIIYEPRPNKLRWLG